MQELMEQRPQERGLKALALRALGLPLAWAVVRAQTQTVLRPRT